MKIEWIGRSACLISKREMTAHDMASQTERVSVDDDGLVILSQLKIQSEPDIEVLPGLSLLGSMQLVAFNAPRAK